MATAPKCSRCGVRHWSTEPHANPKSGVTRIELPAFDGGSPVTERVTMVEGLVTHKPPVTLRVTQVPSEAAMVTAAVTDSHECPICGLAHHRPKTNAERQKAYRGRKA